VLYRKSDGGVWYVKFKHRGDTVRKSTGETDRRRAEAAGRRIRVDHEEENGPGGRRTGVTMSELAGEDIKRALDEGADPETRVRTLKWIWAKVLGHLGDIDVGAVDYDLVLDYVGRRRKDGAKGQTIRRETQSLRRGLLMAERRGWIGTAPRFWPKIKSDPADDKQRGKLVATEVLQLVLGELSGDARDEALFVALTGLRHAEVKRVQAGWVEPLPKGSAAPALLRIPAAAAKTRRERIVALSEQALDIIKRRVEANPTAATVFSGQNHKKAFRDACRRAGVQRVTLRDLRHTYATLALQGTADAVAVQAALGHTDLRTTQRYMSSTVARTVSAGVSVARALESAVEGSPTRGHLGAKNLGSAHSSCGQSTGLLNEGDGVLPCRCCADRCRSVHDISHTCVVEGAPLVVTSVVDITRRRFAWGEA
jgi:integrase